MSARYHLHLLSDSTGETLENIAKAALAQFDGADEVVKHFWPMVRSESHLDRILMDIAANPGLVLFTLVNRDTRVKLENRCRLLGLPAVAALDTVTDAFSNMLGQEAKARPGRQHLMDEAYFARVEAIQFTIAHDDGINAQNWEPLRNPPGSPGAGQPRRLNLTAPQKAALVAFLKTLTDTHVTSDAKFSDPFNYGN